MSEYQKMMRYAGRVYTLKRIEPKGNGDFHTELSTLCRHCDELATYTMVLKGHVQTNTAAYCKCLPREAWINILITAAVVLTSDGAECTFIDSRTL